LSFLLLGVRFTPERARRPVRDEHARIEAGTIS
jgi:hypothetical protein